MDINDATRQTVADMIGHWAVGADPREWAGNSVDYWRAVLDGRPVDEMTAAVIAWSMTRDDYVDMMLITLAHPDLSKRDMTDLIEGRDPMGLNERVGRELIGDPANRPSPDVLKRTADALTLIGAVAPRSNRGNPDGFDWRPLGFAAFASWLQGAPNMSADARVAAAAAPAMPDGSRSVNFLATFVLMCLSERITPAWRRVPGIDPEHPRPTAPASEPKRNDDGRVRSLHLVVPRI